MRIALRTTHQPSLPQWAEVYLRLRRVVPRPGAITGGYSRKIFPPNGKKKTPSTYTEHLKTENVNLGVSVQRPEVGFSSLDLTVPPDCEPLPPPCLIPGQGGSVRIPIGDRESHQYRIHRNLGTWISLRGLGVPRLGGGLILLWGSKNPSPPVNTSESEAWAIPRTKPGFCI